VDYHVLQDGRGDKSAIIWGSVETGNPDPVRGDVAAALMLKAGYAPNEDLKTKLRELLKKSLGKILVLDERRKGYRSCILAAIYLRLGVGFLSFLPLTRASLSSMMPRETFC